jgi:hypothetical protein
LSLLPLGTYHLAPAALHCRTPLPLGTCHYRHLPSLTFVALLLRVTLHASRITFIHHLPHITPANLQQGAKNSQRDLDPRKPEPDAFASKTYLETNFKVTHERRNKRQKPANDLGLPAPLIKTSILAKTRLRNTDNLCLTQSSRSIQTKDSDKMKTEKRNQGYINQNGKYF